MKKKFFGIILALLTFIFLRNEHVVAFFSLNDEYNLFENENLQIENIGGGLVELSKSGEVFSDSLENGILRETYDVSVFGMKLKQITINYTGNKNVTPGGMCVGMAMLTEGILVLGNSDIQVSETEKRNPALEAKLQSGDMILKVNDKKINGVVDFGKMVEKLDGQSINLEVKRGDKIFKTVIEPVYDIYEDKYRLGLWLRDSTAGIGTITYADNDNMLYAALGHGVSDPEIDMLLPVKSGEIVECVIKGIEKSRPGIAGELKGSFNVNAPAYGNILENSEYGLFGELYTKMYNELYPGGMKFASRNAIKEGKATILSTIDGTGVKEYEIEIVKLNSQDMRASKSMVIKITDSELIEKTGGIVQGMSGSPIIQNGRIVGAVTHVLIGEPTKGYGIYIDWMQNM